MHMSLADMLERHRAFDLPLLKMTLRRLLRALDFLHTEAQVTHLDMTVSNIMISIEDETMLQRCAEAELHDPTPRKVVDDTLTIYTSASLPDPKQGKYGVPVLCDFGQARIGESHKTGPLIQPHESRAPEVIFELPWGPSVDIWSVGCLAWALFEGKHLFQDVRTCSGHWKPYAHVAQIVGLIGAPPFQFIQKSKTPHECFDANGTWIHDNPRIPFTTLEDLEMRLDGSEQKKFLRFIRSMLTWLPNERKTAKELLEDPWLQALINKTYNALKILTASPEFPDIKQQEPSVYQHLSAIRSEHPGKNNTRALLDTFTVKGPQMEHQCLVQQPMFMTIWHYERLYGQPLKVSWIKDILRSLLRALDFLHTEAQVIHTDIKTDNIMKSLEDQSVLNQFAEEENHEPTSRKIVDQNLTIYKSRQIQWPRRTGNWVLCDFGSAVIGKVQEAGTYCQPDAYRAPEVVSKMQWGPKIDIWNLGCLAWELVERKVLFRGIRLDDKTYHPYLHVARMVALLGEPPEQFVARNQHTLECFWEDGM
ncbi:hypothetical protein OHC33_007181 [Knufia fluminis]|uniref:EKC/KEOPS complex subunit BUD32 n=1 Tax=Knufia fluminis TaxID=191047 RepID=A0AAN8ECC2_9EURO|nr:hypothetical protein OHC33_007181 [Knufia fluminis]